MTHGVIQKYLFKLVLHVLLSGAVLESSLDCRHQMGRGIGACGYGSYDGSGHPRLS